MAVREEARYALTAEDRSRAAFASFNDRLSGAGRNAKRAGERMSSFFGMGRLGVAAVGAAAVAGVMKITSMADATYESMDAINKLSERTGISVGFLSRFAHVAELSGATLQDVTGGARRFTASIGEAARLGKGAAFDAFHQLGLDAKQLNRMDTAQALLRTADALRRVRTDAQRSELAQDLFGRGGFNLLNTFNLGLEGILEQMREAQELGVGFTKAQANRASAVMDSKTRRDAAAAGVGVSLADIVAPAYTAANDRVTDLITMARNPSQFSAGQMARRGATAVLGGLLPQVPIESTVNALIRLFKDDSEKSLAELREIKANTAKGSIAVAG